MLKFIIRAFRYVRLGTLKAVGSLGKKFPRAAKAAGWGWRAFNVALTAAGIADLFSLFSSDDDSDLDFPVLDPIVMAVLASEPSLIRPRQTKLSLLRSGLLISSGNRESDVYLGMQFICLANYLDSYFLPGGYFNSNLKDAYDDYINMTLKMMSPNPADAEELHTGDDEDGKPIYTPIADVKKELESSFPYDDFEKSISEGGDVVRRTYDFTSFYYDTINNLQE